MTAFLFAVGSAFSLAGSLLFAGGIGDGPKYNTHQNLCGAMTIVLLTASVFCFVEFVFASVS